MSSQFSKVILPGKQTSWNGAYKFTNIFYLFLLPCKETENFLLYPSSCDNFKAILDLKVTDNVGFKGLLWYDSGEDGIAHWTYPLVLLLQGGVG